MVKGKRRIGAACSSQGKKETVGSFDEQLAGGVEGAGDTDDTGVVVVVVVVAAADSTGGVVAAGRAGHDAVEQVAVAGAAVVAGTVEQRGHR